MRKNLIFFGVGVAAFLAFVFFSYLVHKNLFSQIDFDTTVRLQNNMPRRFDELFSWFSSIGSFTPMLIVLLVILVIWRKIVAGILFLAAFGSFHIFELYGKYFVNHPPPPEFMLRTQRTIQFDQFYVRTEFSYPSGHSGRAILLACLLLYIIWQSKWSRNVKVILTLFIFGYVVTMLVSRIYLGEHWTSDVIGGALLAFALSCLALSAQQLFTKSVRTRKSHSGVKTEKS
jgi:undecaprenyl-diphosphatase